MTDASREGGFITVKPGGTAGVYILSQQQRDWDRIFILSGQLLKQETGALFYVPHFQRGERIMSETKIPYKIYLEEQEMPKAWYNLRADMKNKPAPLLNPGTGEPLTAEELKKVWECPQAEKFNFPSEA